MSQLGFPQLAFLDKQLRQSRPYVVYGVNLLKYESLFGLSQQGQDSSTDMPGR